jgi:DMSO reductase anchor subunit
MNVESEHGQSFMHMIPLILFTSLVAAATGMVTGIAGLLFAGAPLNMIKGTLQLVFWFVSGGTLLSLLHLGRKKWFIRAVFGISHSWLSREVFLAGLLAASSGGAYYLIRQQILVQFVPILIIVAAFVALFLTATIGMVYNLEGRSTWNGTLNVIAPLVTAMVLGIGIYAIVIWDTLSLWLFYSFLVVDFSLGTYRLLIIRFHSQVHQHQRFTFPNLMVLARMLSMWRILLSFSLIVAFYMYPRWLVIVFFLILMDRFIFYAAIVDISPYVHIDALKKQRMKAAADGS